jgi:pilus assembly protein Flp/PilA
MVKFVKLLNEVRKDEDGTALLEYSILLGIIAVGAIGYISGLGGWVQAQFSAVCSNLNGAGPNATACSGAAAAT